MGTWTYSGYTEQNDDTCPCKSVQDITQNDMKYKNVKMVYFWLCPFNYSDLGGLLSHWTTENETMDWRGQIIAKKTYYSKSNIVSGSIDFCPIFDFLLHHQENIQ